MDQIESENIAENTPLNSPKNDQQKTRTNQIMDDETVNIQQNCQQTQENTDKIITSVYYKLMGAFNIIMRLLCIVSIIMV
jgi:hypothetical protein